MLGRHVLVGSEDLNASILQGNSDEEGLGGLEGGAKEAESKPEAAAASSIEASSADTGRAKRPPGRP